MSKRVLGSIFMLGVFGCSSSANSHPTTNGSGGEAPQVTDGGGAGGTSSSGGGSASSSGTGTCGPSLAPLPADGYGSNGLAVVGTDVFVVTRGTTGHRIISVVKDGALSQVADVPSDEEVIQVQAPAFYADADAFYIDAVSGSDRPLYRVARNGGAQTVLDKLNPDTNRMHPLFVADANYLYYDAVGSDSLTRIAKSGATPPEALQEREFDTPGGLDSALASDATNVYYATGSSGATAAEFGLAIAQKTPPDAFHAQVDSRNLDAPLCKYDPWYLVFDSGTAYVGCLNAGQSQGYIYSFPPGAAESTVTGTAVVDKPGLNRRVFAVANGNVYFEAQDGMHASLFRMPVTGGAATAILKTEAVDHMVVSGSNLYLTGGCDVQEVPL